MRGPCLELLRAMRCALLIVTTMTNRKMALGVVAAEAVHPPERPSADVECEILPTKLTYRQEEAPRDLSGLLPVVVQRVNKVLEGVVDVEVEWEGGDLHGRVGEHIVRCRVTRLASLVPGAVDTGTMEDDHGRKIATQCFHVLFSILDTNECMLPRGHVMRHRCGDSAICINTIGSYECVCPRVDGSENPSGTADDGSWARLATQERSKWEVSFNTTSRSSCPSSASTHGCCPERAHTSEGSACRARFACPADPCSSESARHYHTCARKASCVRLLDPLALPSNFRCQCPAGLMGNGLQCTPSDPKPQPKVEFDGVTPTEETIRNNYYCDCTKPVVDACSGFPPCIGKHEVCTVTAGNTPKCACKSGYVMHKEYGCVDENPPQLRLKNDPNRDHTLRLKQGDVYHEYAVDIQDENAEEYLRSLKFTYSQSLPLGCLTRMGEFHVNYTVATPWTSPPYVRLTRRVIIDDVDECSLNVQTLKETCPELIPRCDTEAGAVCVNTLGSYTCKCPRFTSGDGFLSGLTFPAGDEPEGYKGGTGCRDTSKPVISLKGPNPRVFRVCECSGVSGIISGRRKMKHSDLKSQQQRHYDDDIKELIRSSFGAELCATPSNNNPSAHDCVFAYDETYQARVDLSREVIVGEPVKKSPLHWAVPYNVQDKAGNAAVTVWRDVHIEEVALEDIEIKLREEILADRQREIDRAVALALEDDRRKRSSSPQSSDAKTCPKCDCSKGNSAFDPSMCEEFCKQRQGTCTVDENSLVIRLLLWLETLVPPYLAPSMLGFLLCVSIFVAAQLLSNILFRSSTSRQSNWYANEERERAMRSAVTYYQGANGSHQQSLPPRSSMSVSGARTHGDSLFTPRSASAPFSPPGSNGGNLRNHPTELDSILASSPIISPHARGDGVQRRSPYNARH